MHRLKQCGPSRRTLRVRYLLEGTGLFGGVKVVLAQANALAALGHEVTLVSREPAPDWYPVRVGFRQADPLDEVEAPAPDVTVATYWTTIAPALRSGGATVHYCQGYEGFHTHNRADHPGIERAYAERLPAMVVSPHLGALLRERFGRPSRRVPPSLESFWHPSAVPEDRRPPTILVVGPLEVDWKGVETALHAIRRLRRSGCECSVIRLSQMPLCDAERSLLDAQEFHHRLPPEKAAAVFRRADLLLAPSREPEGFGLPVLEAMASGVPVVASDVSCFRGFAADAAVLVAADDEVAFAESARELLSDRSLWQRHRDAGLRVAARFSQQQSAMLAEEALLWVADGGWRGDLEETAI